MMKKRVTLREVAQACGVTASAVSYALRGSGEVSQALRERIVATARALGYVPSGAARRLRGSAPRRIGIVAPMPGMPAYARHHEALDSACAALGIETVTHYHYWHGETERRILAALLDSGITGLVLHPATLETGATLAELAAGGLGVPFVTFGEVEPRAELASLRRGSFQPHPQAIADLCIPQILARGHRRVAFIFQGPLLPEGGVIQTLRRFQEKAARGTGLELEFFYLDDSSSPIRRKVLQKVPCGIADFVATDRLLADRFLDSPFEATAAITQDDLTSLALLSGCERRGLRVPEDLSIVSISGSYVCECGARPITHLAVRVEEVVSDLLARLLAQAPPATLQAAYPMAFVEGATLGSLKAAKPKGRRAGRQEPLIL